MPGISGIAVVAGCGTAVPNAAVRNASAAVACAVAAPVSRPVNSRCRPIWAIPRPTVKAGQERSRPRPHQAASHTVTRPRPTPAQVAGHPPATPCNVAPTPTQMTANSAERTARSARCDGCGANGTADIVSHQLREVNTGCAWSRSAPDALLIAQFRLTGEDSGWSGGGQESGDGGRGRRGATRTAHRAIRVFCRALAGDGTFGASRGGRVAERGPARGSRGPIGGAPRRRSVAGRCERSRLRPDQPDRRRDPPGHGGGHGADDPAAGRAAEPAGRFL